jgi:hypothetical protein
MCILEEIIAEYRVTKKLSKMHQVTNEIEKKAKVFREADGLMALILFMMKRFKSEAMGFFDDLLKEYDQMLSRIKYALLGDGSVKVPSVDSEESQHNPAEVLEQAKKIAHSYIYRILVPS